MRNITRFAFVMSIFVLLVGLSACDQLLRILSDDQMTSADVPQFTDFSGDISVGVVLPRSGRIASSFGEPMEHGLQLALEEINSGQLGDARIKLIIEDDMSTEEGAVAAFEKLIREDDVSVILGPATSAMTKDAFPIAEENSVVAISSDIRCTRPQRNWRLCLSRLARDRCVDTQRNQCDSREVGI